MSNFSLNSRTCSHALLLRPAIIYVFKCLRVCVCARDIYAKKIYEGESHLLEIYI